VTKQVGVQTLQVLGSGRRRRTKGAELIEFTFTFLPYVCMVFVLLDIGWAIFVKSTLECAVRDGVRRGITITGTQATDAHSNLTAMVKSIVQSRALWILRGDAGLSKIKVHYFRPPDEGSTADALDVCDRSDGNSQNNIMQVSIEGYTMPALLPRLFTTKTAVDKAGTNVTAMAADLIEPSRDLPPIGVAP
jgi:hypothetical protein